MLEKTIKQILNKKVKKWVESIDDDIVKAQVLSNLIITGGCFTSMIQNETPNDYDCYFRTKESALIVSEYYVKKWNEQHQEQKNKLGITCKVFVLDGANPSKELLDYYQIKDLKESQSRMISNCEPERIKIIFPSDGISGDPKEANQEEELGVDNLTELDETAADEVLKKEKKPFNPVFLSTNAITLSDDIQIVVRFYGEPSELHSNYDYEHTKAYWTSWDNQLVISAKVYECVTNKSLVYTGSKYPLCSLFRMRKFIGRGWRINAGQILKMAMQISDLNLKDIDVLEDQLIGVDSLYFMHLINHFKQMKEKDPGFVLDSGYIVSIIDKIF